MKTKGMKHQLEGLRQMAGREFFALFCEQGTGKTFMLLADAERNYAAGKIDAMLVIAPKGVHTNWVRREIPTHMSSPVIARAWAAGAGKFATRKLNELLAPRDEGEQPPLRVLAMNIDAINTKDGFAFAEKFLNCTRSMIVVDESSRIKNPKSKRTERLMDLAPLGALRRIASGTPITNAPGDIFAQMEFLESGLLETTSHRAFVAEYAELLDSDNPMFKKMVQKNPRIAFAQIVARDKETGAPIWRNLDKLQAIIAPHSFRVLKEDCLDLPAKIYQTHYFELGKVQRAAYDLMEKELRLAIAEDQIETVSGLNSLIKLQQITSGFALTKEGVPFYVSEENPRLAALVDLLQEQREKFIIWARFREELKSIASTLRGLGYKIAEYHGGVTTKDREAAVDGFQTGDIDGFVGQPQSGGIGLTLTAAKTVIYYSNDFNLETRLQSEDRAHRIGTRSNVLYIDLVAEDTIDEPISEALQRKADVASLILGDKTLLWAKNRAA